MAMTYPSGPQAGEIRPKAVWIWVGVGLMVAAFIAFVVLIFVQLAGLRGSLDGLDRVPAGGNITVSLDPGEYAVYVEDHGYSTVRISGPNGDVQLQSPAATETYDIDTFHATVRSTFVVDARGEFAISNEGANAVRVGPRIIGQLVRTVLIPFGVGGVIGITGLVVLVVTLIRRSQSKKRLWAAQYGPRGPGGTGGTSGPVGSAIPAAQFAPGPPTGSGSPAGPGGPAGSGEKMGQSRQAGSDAATGPVGSGEGFAPPPQPIN